MNISIFKKLIFYNTDSIKTKNSNFFFNPIYFFKEINIYNGTVFVNRHIFFFHNKIKAGNLFLTKKIKPMPVLKKKNKK